MELNISKPLERGFDLDLDEDGSVPILVMHERLPNYCHDCGMIGHTKKECPTEDHNRDYTPKSEAKYADWLQAPHPI